MYVFARTHTHTHTHRHTHTYIYYILYIYILYIYICIHILYINNLDMTSVYYEYLWIICLYIYRGIFSGTVFPNSKPTSLERSGKLPPWPMWFLQPEPIGAKIFGPSVLFATLPQPQPKLLRPSSEGPGGGSKLGKLWGKGLEWTNVVYFWMLWMISNDFSSNIESNFEYGFELPKCRFRSVLSAGFAST